MSSLKHHYHHLITNIAVGVDNGLIGNAIKIPQIILSLSDVSETVFQHYWARGSARMIAPCLTLLLYPGLRPAGYPGGFQVELYFCLAVR